MKRALLLLGVLSATLTFGPLAVANPPLKKAKWTTLFDGKTLTGWHRYNKTDTNGWRVDNGTLTTDGKQGDLVTDKEYENFELEFEFKVQPKGNSGVIYKVLEDPQYNQPYISGPEFQVIDDKGYEWKDSNGKLMKLNDSQLTGANYDILPPSDLSVVKAAGEWNRGRILIQNNHVEHWLNGKKVVEYDYGSDAWKAMVAKSKFSKWAYATPRAKGKIALQGHGDTVWYKAIRIREM
jgi:hypothetical protein